jgi:hypothetical protein
MKILCFLFLVSFISFHTTVKAGSHEHHENEEPASNRFRKPAQNHNPSHLFSPHAPFITPRHAKRRYALQQLSPPNYTGPKSKPYTSEEKKRATLEEQIKETKLFLNAISTPTNRKDTGLLKPDASRCFSAASPGLNNSYSLSSILTSLKQVKAKSPTQTLTSITGHRYPLRTRRENFHKKLFKEFEGATVIRSNFPLDVSQILSHENQLLEHLKSKIYELKSNFFKTPSLNTLSRKLLAEKAYSTINISKEMGFSRTVVIRDRRLTDDNGASIKRFVIENDALIDPNLVDDKGRTNVDRMRAGLAPIGPDKKSINLHHIFQSDYHAIIEVSSHAHYQAGSLQLHYKRGLPEFGESEVDRKAFGTFRGDHWKLRAAMYQWDEWEECYAMKQDRPKHWTRATAKRKKAIKRGQSV